MADPEQAAYIEMFASLRHDRFIRGDYQQNEIDTGNSGEHIFNESLVAGNIDEAEAETRGELQVSETQIDGNAPALFFFQAIRVDSGQRLNQSGLAVIDMSSRADDDVLHTCEVGAHSRGTAAQTSAVRLRL